MVPAPLGRRLDPVAAIEARRSRGGACALELIDVRRFQSLRDRPGHAVRQRFFMAAGHSARPRHRASRMRELLSSRFANVDDRLTLWVDGKLPFGEGLDLRIRPSGPPWRPPQISSRPASAARQAAIE